MKKVIRKYWLVNEAIFIDVIFMYLFKISYFETIDLKKKYFG